MPIASKTDIKTVTSGALAAALLLSLAVYFGSARDSRDLAPDPVDTAESGVGAGAGRYAEGTEAPETGFPVEGDADGQAITDAETSDKTAQGTTKPETSEPETAKTEKDRMMKMKIPNPRTVTAKTTSRIWCTYSTSAPTTLIQQLKRKPLTRTISILI